MLDTIGGQIQRLERQQRKRQAFIEGNDWYSFRVTPSCPPDRRVHVRGGLAHCARNTYTTDYRAYTIPNLTADLTDPSQVTIDVTFTNANWYLAYALLLKLPTTVSEPSASDWSFWLWGTGTEVETSTEAEAHMEWNILHESDPWYSFYDGFHGYPLCGLILRNNGIVGAGCRILPVDVVNRGRSYMWPRDIRPRWYVAR